MTQIPLIPGNQLPIGSHITRLLMTTPPGSAFSISGEPLADVERIARRFADGRRMNIDVRQDGDLVLVEILTNGNPSTGIHARISAMKPGDEPLVLKDTNLNSVRATASRLNQQSGNHYKVNQRADGVIVVMCTPGKTAAGLPRYPFRDQQPGMAFTVEPDAHAGIEPMRVMCSRYGKLQHKSFVARENIDGSITVRCYAEGGLPAKWAIDREHAQLQQAIIDADPSAWPVSLGGTGPEKVEKA